MSAAPSLLEKQSPFRAGLLALRRFARPFVLMQVAAVLLVIAYRGSAQVRDACAALVGLKRQGGLAFSAMASVIAGVVLPEAATLATVPDERARPGRLGTLAFTTAFFLVNGAVVDLFYRCQHTSSATPGRRPSSPRRWPSISSSSRRCGYP